MPRKMRILSLHAAAFPEAGEDSPLAYSTIWDRSSPDPIALLEELERDQEHPAHLEPDESLLRACDLAGIDFKDFQFLYDKGLLLGDRIKRFTCTRDVDPLKAKGRTRQAISKSIRRQLERARLVVPLKALLTNNVEGFMKIFPGLVTTWKGGTIERLVQRQSLIEKLGQGERNQFRDAARALLDDTKEQLHDSLRLAWDGTSIDEHRKFLSIYNQLRVSAVFAPDETFDFLANFKDQVSPRQFWLARAVDRSLHLTGNVEACRDWIQELANLLDFESQVPPASLKTAAYIGLYYADGLSATEWSVIAHPDQSTTAWSPSTMAQVLKESYQNTLENWYHPPQQSEINLLRVALYLRCHPDKRAIQGSSKKLLQMIVGRGKKLRSASASNPLALLQSLAR